MDGLLVCLSLFELVVFGSLELRVGFSFGAEARCQIVYLTATYEVHDDSVSVKRLGRSGPMLNRLFIIALVSEYSAIFIVKRTIGEA